MPKFSIIIPCFNGFDLMKCALESLENQTFQDFEVLIIDDASTDDSFEKLKQYQENSKLNMILFQNAENLGAGRTRNIGLQNATGKFVTFLDADDFVENNLLEVLNQIFESEKLDCIIFDYFLKTKKKELKQKSLLKGKKGKISKSDALVYSTGSTWGKAYLLKNIKDNKIEFPKLKRNEDLPFNKLAISVSESIYYCDKNLYYYVDNPNSLVHNINLMDIQNNVEGFRMIEENLKQDYDWEVEALFLKEYLYAITMNLVRSKATAKEIKEHIEKCIEKYPKVFENESKKYLNRFQKMCMKAIKIKSVFLLRLLLVLKDIAKKIR